MKNKTVSNFTSAYIYAKHIQDWKVNMDGEHEDHDTSANAWGINTGTELPAIQETPDKALAFNRSGISFHRSTTKPGGEEGSIKEYLRRDGEVAYGDMIRLTRVLSKLGFVTEDDLEILGKALF